MSKAPPASDLLSRPEEAGQDDRPDHRLMLILSIRLFQDHIAVTKAALAGVPGIHPSRPGRKILIRADGAGITRQYLAWLARYGVAYSIGYTLPAGMPDLYALIPEHAWQVAIDADGDVREGAALVELTDLLTARGLLTGYPEAMRVIVRRERPHPAPNCASTTSTDTA